MVCHMYGAWCDVIGYIVCHVYGVRNDIYLYYCANMRYYVRSKYIWSVLLQYYCINIHYYVRIKDI